MAEWLWRQFVKLFENSIVGSNPSLTKNGEVTQSVECGPYKTEVVGSSPAFPIAY